VVRNEEESAGEFEDDPSPLLDLSESAERSDGIEDENNITLDASELPAIQPDVIQYASAICLKFGRLEQARFYACAVIPGSGYERLLASDLYISHMSQVGYCVIADIFHDENAPLPLCRARTLTISSISSKRLF
jgi:hypothetical protein